MFTESRLENHLEDIEKPEDVQPAPEELKEIKYEEIANLREPLEIILWQLRRRIEQGSFRVLIGDDASGRIPTLILRKFIQQRYKELGFDLPQTFFLAGTRSYEGIRNNEEMQHKKGRMTDFLSHLEIERIEAQQAPNVLQQISRMFRGRNKISPMPAKMDEKVLIVTDTIESGESLTPLVEGLNQAGIRYDIATIGMLGDQKELERKFGVPITTGNYHLPRIYGRHRLAGVEKVRTDLFSKPAWTAGEEDRLEMRKKVVTAREDITILSQELLDWYHRNTLNT